MWLFSSRSRASALAGLAFLLPALGLSLTACAPEHGDDEEDGSELASESHSVNEAGESEAMSGMTEAHNAVRASVEPAPATPLPPLTWSDQLASVAQAYADGCVYRHSQGEYGENLFAQANKQATPEEVVEAWGPKEASSYDYATGTCAPNAKCGHYTQIAWRDSTRVGCGVAHCTTGSPWGAEYPEWEYWVCNYDPPGNWQGEKPY